MGSLKRMDVKGILRDPDLRRKLTIDATKALQAREGIETTDEQAERAFFTVTEAEKATFFSLSEFRGSSQQPDTREAEFVAALEDGGGGVRFDVARRDFAAIDGSPLAFEKVSLLGPLFRDEPALEPAWARAAQGLSTANDPRFVRQWWEIRAEDIGWGNAWVFFAKGGEFSRFYQSLSLVVRWRDGGAEIKEYNDSLYGKGGWSRQVRNIELYGLSGLNWPRRTQKGFNVRMMPEGCIFADKGPAILPCDPDDGHFLLGVLNSALAEFVMRALTTFGSWEVGAVKKIPVPSTTLEARKLISELSREICHLKADWDSGNETSIKFDSPWLLRDSLVGPSHNISQRLDALASAETEAEDQLRGTYSRLDGLVFAAYGLDECAEVEIRRQLVGRPEEVLWPQMEDKGADQKRMEHVWRLLSFAVKRVVQAAPDGMILLSPLPGHKTLAERVFQEMEVLFPELSVNQVEAEINTELRKRVRGYKAANQIEDWLENQYFEYHASLYRNRPIIWHVASKEAPAKAAFSVLVDYHRFDRDAMARLRSGYLSAAIGHFRKEASRAGQENRTEDKQDSQSKLEEAEALDQKLQAIEEGRHSGREGGDQDYRILTPWKSPAQRPSGWDPDIDDGVEVNIAPFRRARALRVAP